MNEEESSYIGMSNEALYWVTLQQLRMLILTVLTTDLREFVENPSKESTIEEGGCVYKDKCVIITETLQQINQAISTVLAACEIDEETVIH